MRNMMLALLAMLAGGMAVIGTSAPAAAEYDYPWCVFGGGLGPAGDCSYQTLQQCQASSYGRWTTYCDLNKRVRFAKQLQQERQQREKLRRQQPRDY